MQPEWLPAGLFEKLKLFLEANGLRWEGAPERALVVKNAGNIIASAAIDQNVVKYVAVDRTIREAGLATGLVSEIIQDAFGRGKTHLFLFTKAESADSFSNMAFTPVCEYGGMALLECGMKTVKSYAESLKKHRHPGFNGAIVMNANPFTKGHRYLIENAARQVDRLHIFVVREDRSAFPFSARLRMIEDGTCDIDNAVVHKGSEYVLSYVTFPSYFIKKADEAAEIQAGLDVELFRRHIAPALGIKARFVGEEPFDASTRAYNAKMNEILEKDGILVREIARLEDGEGPVSASRVRKYIQAGEMEKAYSLLTPSAVEFMKSNEGTCITERMMDNENS